MTFTPYHKVDQEEWDAFCLESPDAWFFHTSMWLAYQEARGRENYSFCITREGRIAAVCPLMRDGDRFLFEGHPGPWPAGDPVGWEERLVELFVRTTCEEHSLRSASFMSCPLAAPPRMLRERAWEGWTSRVADLSLGKDDLRRGLRKSYHSLVNWGLRTLEIKEASAAEAHTIHMQASGRETRSHETWRMMDSWIDTGHGMCCVARRGGSRVGFAYFIIYKDVAYYASAAALENNVGHALLWWGLLRLKELGIEKLEIGWQGQAHDEKGRQIEFFKSGFPGDDVPVLTVEIARET